MMGFSDELIAKLSETASEAEIAELLRAEGKDEALAERLWKELEAKRGQGGKEELSPDELEAVAGGKRDWLKEGCAATVEPGSNCWGTDWCALWPVTYDHAPSTSICPTCRVNMTMEERTDYYWLLKCQNCGGTDKQWIVDGK